LPGLTDLLRKYLVALLQLHRLFRLKYWGEHRKFLWRQSEVTIKYSGIHVS